MDIIVDAIQAFTAVAGILALGVAFVWLILGGAR